MTYRTFDIEFLLSKQAAPLAGHVHAVIQLWWVAA